MKIKITEFFTKNGDEEDFILIGWRWFHNGPGKYDDGTLMDYTYVTIILFNRNLEFLFDKRK
jgi:hypothetical protein